MRNGHPNPPESLLHLNGEPAGVYRHKFVRKLNMDKLDGFDALWVEQLKSRYQEGDEVWEYRDIGILSGWGGYVLLRGDRVAARLVTMRS
jgi:hypothetical protein